MIYDPTCPADREFVILQRAGWTVHTTPGSRLSTIRSTFRVVAILVAALLGCAPAGRRPGHLPAPQQLRLLLVNDVYVADTLRDGTGGLARVAAFRDSLAREGRIIFLLAGDVLSPSLLSKWYGGRQMVEAFNAAGLDYATFGNHEFELDRDTLIARLGASRFKWVSANCTLADGQAFPGVPPWDTLSVGGVRVGLFGVTLRSDYRRYVRCTDPDSAAHAAVKALRSAGAELVIGLTHQDVAADSALLSREPALDLILGGHEHDAHTVRVNGRHTVKADANARTVQLVTLIRDGGRWRQKTELHRMDSRVRMDSATAEVARAWNDTLMRRLGPERVLATARAPLDGRDVTSRFRESSLGDVVTDALREGTGADVALLNAGTMRIDDLLGPGPITNYQLESIFLFADETRIITFPLTGARLRELLEHSLSDRVHGHGGFLQVSGITFRYDLSRPSGSRVVAEILRSDGRPIQPEETLRVALNIYTACSGGDGYEVPEARTACAETERAPRAADLLAAHITTRLRGRLDAPPATRMIEVRGGAGR